MTPITPFPPTTPITRNANADHSHWPPTSHPAALPMSRWRLRAAGACLTKQRCNRIGLGMRCTGNPAQAGVIRPWLALGRQLVLLGTPTMQAVDAAARIARSELAATLPRQAQP